MTAENIGYCAWCGVLDHHLVDDLCPGCVTKVTDAVTKMNASNVGITKTDLQKITAVTTLKKMKAAARSCR